MDEPLPRRKLIIKELRRRSLILRNTKYVNKEFNDNSASILAVLVIFHLLITERYRASTGRHYYTYARDSSNRNTKTHTTV